MFKKRNSLGLKRINSTGSSEEAKSGQRTIKLYQIFLSQLEKFNETYESGSASDRNKEKQKEMVNIIQDILNELPNILTIFEYLKQKKYCTN